VLTALVSATLQNLPSPTGTFTFYGPKGAISGNPTITTITDSNGFPALQATLTVTVTASTYGYFTFQYSGDSNYIGGASNNVFIAVPDFSISPASNGVSVTAGQSQQLGLTVSSLYGFTGTVGNFTCGGLPAEATCTFNPTQMANSGTTTLTITTAAIGQVRRRASAEPLNRWWVIGTGVLIGVCLIRTSKHKRGVGIVSLICVLLLLPSCGGGGGGTGGGGGGGGGGGTTPNPTPSITSLSPTQIASGSTPVPTVLVNGSGFISTSTVSFGGVPHPSVTNNGSQISLELSASDIATLGNVPVVVTNPTPGGGASNSMDFNVTTGTPTGNFTVTVTASSGSLTHSITLYLTVQ
jgi:hypothetical protein